MELFKKVLQDTFCSLMTVAFVLIALLIAHNFRYPVWGWIGAVAFAIVLSFLFHINSYMEKEKEVDKEEV